MSIAGTVATIAPSAAADPVYVFSHFAGSDVAPGAVDGVGAEARFWSPRGVAVDSVGNVFVADTSNCLIRKITPAGIVSSFAGAAGQSGVTDGVGASARFISPDGIAIDAHGVLYVADSGGMRKITADGVVTSLPQGLPRDETDLPAMSAPLAVAVASDGTVFFSDLNNTIQKVTPAGLITLLAGSPGQIGQTNGPGISAKFSFVYGLAMSGEGDLYVADTYNSCIRTITPTAMVSTIYGRGDVGESTKLPDLGLPWGIAIDPEGTIYTTVSNSVRKITRTGTLSTLAGGTIGMADGIGSAAQFDSPLGLALDAGGNVYVADTGNDTIRRIAPNGATVTLAGKAPHGTADGAGSAARFYEPQGVAADPNGNVYVADTSNHTIRKITPDGTVSTFAGTPGQRGFADGTSEALFDTPKGLACDAGGNIYVADSGNNAIRQITPTGYVRTVIHQTRPVGSDPYGGGIMLSPSAVAVGADGQVVYFGANAVCRGYQLVAGSFGKWGNSDGIGMAARFGSIPGIVVDEAGIIYVADGSRIRKITSSGEVTTFVGSFEVGSSDGQGTTARFKELTSLARDSTGSFYVVDVGNRSLRRITSDGMVTTIAGASGQTGADDGKGISARFSNPWGITIDAAGNLYVVEKDAHTVRKGTLLVPPAITTQPESQSAVPGAIVSLFVNSSVGSGGDIRWQRNGSDLAGKTGSTLTLSNFEPASTGLYTAVLSSSSGSTVSKAAIMGIATTNKVFGAGEEVAPDVLHPNGKTFDQVLLTGEAEAITTDYTFDQITRTSFIDLDGDIVQVEFSGPGTLSIVLDDSSGPATPERYFQPSVRYMKGHAGIVITGADERTNVSAFTVGRATAFDLNGGFNIIEPISPTNDPADNRSPLFQGHAATHYDGIADLAFIAITSTNGRFGGVRTANASYFAAKGLTGIYAPGVQFTGPVYLGNITAFDDATPVIVLGSATNTTAICGGDLWQANARALQVRGLTQLKFQAGSDSHGNVLPAKANRAKLEQNGADVTTQIVADSP